jgi:hypothetical protein
MGPRDFHSESKLGSKWSNSTKLSLGGIGRAGDLSAIAYPQMMALVLAMAANWDPPWVTAGICRSYSPPYNEPDTDSFFDSPNGAKRRPYGRPWIGWLSADRAAGLVVPSVLVNERTPEGGLLLSATTVQFDPENADQVALSRHLSEIMLERGGQPGI